MVQNHLTQLMTVVAMEVPASFEADAIQMEKLKVLHSIPPIEPRTSSSANIGLGVRRSQDSRLSGGKRRPAGFVD